MKRLPRNRDLYDLLTENPLMFVEDAPEDRIHYVRNCLQRFTHTVSWIPTLPENPRILDVGCFPPCMMQILLHVFEGQCILEGITHDWKIWPGSSTGVSREKISIPWDRDKRQHVLVWRLNAEKDRFPYSDEGFDLVLCTEVIEHLIFSPTHMLYEINRVLKPGGILILSTPNALNIVDTLKLAAGRSPYDPYSGYGVYGRHNRLFTQKELKALLTACNFRIFSSSVSFVVPVDYGLSGVELRRRRMKNLFRQTLNHIRRIVPVAFLGERMGDTLFMKLEKSGPPRETYPDWLYKSRYRSILEKNKVLKLSDRDLKVAPEDDSNQP